MSEWISIKDKFPPLRTIIIAYDTSVGSVLHAIFDANEIDLDNCSITHWMPFPEPPK